MPEAPAPRRTEGPRWQTELMQLRETEPIRFLNDHDRCVRDVDTDLDHGRRDQHVEVARFEARHQIATFRRPQSSVQEADAIAAELGALQAFRFGFCGARL